MFKIWEGLRSKADKDNDGQVSNEENSEYLHLCHYYIETMIMKSQTIKFIIYETFMNLNQDPLIQYLSLKSYSLYFHENIFINIKTFVIVPKSIIDF